MLVMQILEAERPSDYLSRLATSDLGRAYKAMVITEMKIPLGCTVLDLGCGPGADLPPLADAVGPAGRVVGIDHDAEAVTAAAAGTTDLTAVEVVVGDAHQMPLAAGSVDRVHTDRVLQHVARPADVIAEVARVLRPGGVAAFAEPDWDTLIVDFPDPAVPAAYRAFVVDHVVAHARVGRQVPGLCSRQDLMPVRVVPVTAVFRDAVEADQVLGFARVTSRAVQAGYLSAPDAAAWLRHLGAEQVFVSVSLFVTLAEKPATDVP